MALITQAVINTALATLFEDEVANQINRAVVLAQILDVRPGTGKNISWIVRTGTATPTGAVIADGADVSVYNNDTKAPATLNFGTYHDAFSITGKAMASARAAGNPRELAALLMDEMGDSVERLARAIASDVYLGTGATDYIHGLLDSTVPAIGDTGTYAGIVRGSVAQWKGNVLDAASAGLSFPLLRQLRRTIYTACGRKPDLYICDPIQHEKLGLLYQGERRYIQDVRTAMGTIKLDGGYQVLEFDGVPVVEDSTCPASTFVALNTRAVHLTQLTDAPEVMARSMGSVQLAGTPEEQLGAGKMKLSARIQPLALTGDAFKFALYCYPQVVVKSPNTCGYIENLAA